jgi:type VI secretion system protein ImpM
MVVSVPGPSVISPVSSDRVFLFGKTPAHGDFVCRGLSATERAAWDRWCNAEFASARARLGERFEEAHLRTPAWRFVLAPTPGDTTWMAGCVAPSCDRVGRRFLLALGVKRSAPLDPTAEGARLAGLMLSLIREAFHSGAEADQLIAAAEEALASRELPDARPPPVEMTDWRIGHIGPPLIAIAFGDLS